MFICKFHNEIHTDESSDIKIQKFVTRRKTHRRCKIQVSEVKSFNTEPD